MAGTPKRNYDELPDKIPPLDKKPLQEKPKLVKKVKAIKQGGGGAY